MLASQRSGACGGAEPPAAPGRAPGQALCQPWRARCPVAVPLAHLQVTSQTGQRRIDLRPTPPSSLHACRSHFHSDFTSLFPGDVWRSFAPTCICAVTQAGALLPISVSFACWQFAPGAFLRPYAGLRSKQPEKPSKRPAAATTSCSGVPSSARLPITSATTGISAGLAQLAITVLPSVARCAMALSSTVEG